MTDEDRQLLLELRRMTDACGAFCAGVIESDLSREDQLALSSWLADMAERIRQRAVRTPVVIEGEAASPKCQTGGARSEEQQTFDEGLIAVRTPPAFAPAPAHKSCPRSVTSPSPCSAELATPRRASRLVPPQRRAPRQRLHGRSPPVARTARPPRGRGPERLASCPCGTHRTASPLVGQRKTPTMILSGLVRIRWVGGADGIRTRDPRTASAVRYQLRYSPK